MSRDQALDRIAALIETGEGGTVFTPNVDHVVLAEESPRFRAAYASAALSLVDGMPVLWACRLLGVPAPEKVSGSDLVRPLAARAAHAGWRVYLLGGGAGVAERAARRLTRELPGVCIVGTDARDVDMSTPPQSRLEHLQEIRDVRPDLVLAALGSPKGELWAAEARAVLKPAVILSVGAALDFLAGVRRRAPPWMSRWGLEWLHRLAHEPRRLWRRYLVRGPRFVPIVLRHRRGERREPTR